MKISRKAVKASRCDHEISRVYQDVQKRRDHCPVICGPRCDNIDHKTGEDPRHPLPVPAVALRRVWILYMEIQKEDSDEAYRCHLEIDVIHI